MKIIKINKMTNKQTKTQIIKKKASLLNKQYVNPQCGMVPGSVQLVLCTAFLVKYTKNCF